MSPINLFTMALLFFWASCTCSHAETLDGDWVLPDGSAIVRVAVEGETLRATLIDLLRPRNVPPLDEGPAGERQRDRHNPKAELRSRFLQGMLIAEGTRSKGAFGQRASVEGIPGEDARIDSKSEKGEVKKSRRAERIDGGGGEAPSYRGHIYDPRSGRRYRCELSLVAPDVLRLHAYIGLKALGETQYWQALASYRSQTEALFARVKAGDDA